MQLDIDLKKCSDVGLVVKHGNVNNIVFFWDENENAAIYSLEVYRIDWQYEKEGFFEEAKLLQREVKVYNSGPRIEIDKYLSTDMPALIKKQFVTAREWNDTAHRSKVLFYDFTAAKPVCVINVDRNKFYHSINDLPCGNYIAVLKIEDRQGEIATQSVPYYFHIDDAEKTANERANRIASAAAHDMCI